MIGHRMRTDRLNDMLPPVHQSIGLRPGSKDWADYVNARWVPREGWHNETGKLEWVYRDGAQHGRHL